MTRSDSSSETETEEDRGNLSSNNNSQDSYNIVKDHMFVFIAVSQLIAM